MIPVLQTNWGIIRFSLSFNGWNTIMLVNLGTLGICILYNRPLLKCRIDLAQEVFIGKVL
jgi:hypothetical protein